MHVGCWCYEPAKRSGRSGWHMAGGPQRPDSSADIDYAAGCLIGGLEDAAWLQRKSSARAVDLTEPSGPIRIAGSAVSVSSADGHLALGGRVPIAILQRDNAFSLASRSFCAFPHLGHSNKKVLGHCLPLVPISWTLPVSAWAARKFAVSAAVARSPSKEVPLPVGSPASFVRLLRALQFKVRRECALLIFAR